MVPRRCLLHVFEAWRQSAPILSGIICRPLLRMVYSGVDGDAEIHNVRVIIAEVPGAVRATE
jgi:hypothetical protein